MTGVTLVSVVVATLLLIGIVRWRVRGMRGAERAALAAQSQRRAREAGPLPEPITVTEPAGTEASPPPRDTKGLGAQVLEHLRQIEARASPGLAAHVIPIFLQDTSTRLKALRDAVARKDGDAAYRLAHTLHGSAATVGAASLERGCAEIIRELRSGSFDRCEVLTTELDADFESIRQAVAE